MADNELHRTAFKDMHSMLDRFGIGYYFDEETGTTSVDEEHQGWIETNIFIVNINTGVQDMGADLIGIFRYGFRLGLATADDLPELFSPGVLDAVTPLLKDLPMQWPDGRIATLDGRATD